MHWYWIVCNAVFLDKGDVQGVKIALVECYNYINIIF